MTSTAPTPDRDAAGRAGVAEYRCRRCGRVLGTVDRGALTLGGAVLVRKVTLHCAGCGRRWVWNPTDAPATSG